MNKPKIDEFMKELSALTQKYGISIGGCGCCHSPWLWNISEKDFVGDDLKYDQKEERYVCRK
jgi:hypothetical protein